MPQCSTDLHALKLTEISVPDCVALCDLEFRQLFLFCVCVQACSQTAVACEHLRDSSIGPGCNSRGHKGLPQVTSFNMCWGFKTKGQIKLGYKLPLHRAVSLSLPVEVSSKTLSASQPPCLTNGTKELATFLCITKVI
ncbi:Hypothetical predicted protein [Podarcis lilfordi]|uniref:Uncharacterized protein n=1 Tax=Podarcis lilfordi TaxID=74358 RepID=A0AA35KT78_9SAUR|nr:Hypothetical predicted protein [Podarcis lilfordi]